MEVSFKKRKMQVSYKGSVQIRKMLECMHMELCKIQGGDEKFKVILAWLMKERFSENRFLELYRDTTGTLEINTISIHRFCNSCLKTRIRPDVEVELRKRLSGMWDKVLMSEPTLLQAMDIFYVNMWPNDPPWQNERSIEFVWKTDLLSLVVVKDPIALELLYAYMHHYEEDDLRFLVLFRLSWLEVFGILTDDRWGVIDLPFPEVFKIPE